MFGSLNIIFYVCISTVHDRYSCSTQNAAFWSICYDIIIILILFYLVVNVENQDIFVFYRYYVWLHGGGDIEVMWPWCGVVHL